MLACLLCGHLALIFFLFSWKSKRPGPRGSRQRLAQWCALEYSSLSPVSDKRRSGTEHSQGPAWLFLVRHGAEPRNE